MRGGTSIFLRCGQDAAMSGVGICYLVGITSLQNARGTVSFFGLLYGFNVRPLYFIERIISSVDDIVDNYKHVSVRHGFDSCPRDEGAVIPYIK